MKTTLERLNEHAAALDVGSEKIHASIAGDTPRVFDTMTGSLYRLRDWLLSAGVETVAMEATGVYWLCVYEILAVAGLKPVVVNGKHVQNLPGRKTDMKDSQWLATLHAHGLLRGGFVPEIKIRQLQDYMRLRQDHISLAATHVQHMQKALTRMNIKVDTVLSSVTGVSGQAIIGAILAGCREPEELVKLADASVLKKKRERLLASLEGHWKEEQLFALRQAHELWHFYQGKIRECDQRIEGLLKEQTAELPPVAAKEAPAKEAGTQEEVPARKPLAKEAGSKEESPARKPLGKEAGTKARRKPRAQNAPQIENLHGMLEQLCGGIDPTSIPGLSDYSLLSLISETGTDLTRWPSAKAFTTWLGLAPGSHQSGKRRGRVSLQRNRAGRLFCVVARSLAKSVDKALGGFYRRLKARRGGLIANQALARKLGEMYWRVLTKGADYVEEGLKAYEEKVKKQEMGFFAKMASKLGFKIMPAGEVVH